MEHLIHQKLLKLWTKLKLTIKQDWLFLVTFRLSLILWNSLKGMS